MANKLTVDIEHASNRRLFRCIIDDEQMSIFMQ